jgi:glucan phosphoethanolaminetransferase (alkaline phosphatase superfamily)
MSSSSKSLSAFLAFAPAVFFVLYLIAFFFFFFDMLRNAEMLQNTEVSPFYFFKNMIWMVVMAILMALTALAALIYFIIHAVNNKAIDSNERLIWILVFVFAGMIGFPIYWYLRIRNSDPAQSPATNF